MPISNPNTNVIKSFWDCFCPVASQPDQFLSDPDRDFSRRSPLSFEKTMLIPYRLQQLSIENSLGLFAHDDPDLDVRSQAISQRRKKISARPFEQIFHDFNRKTSQNNLFNGFRLLAVDGSEVSVYGCSNPRETSADDPYTARSKRGGIRRYVHVNAAFDVLEKTYVDFIFQPGSLKNEDSALMQIARRQSAANDQKTIYICDRGYESQMSFYQLNALGCHYVIRIKDQDSAKRMTKDLSLPYEDTYDVSRTILLSANHRNALLRKEGETRPIHFISSHNRYEEFKAGNKLVLNVRIVRYLLKDADGSDSYITVITNLPQEVFTADQIQQIYGYRWQLEVGFYHIKYDLGIEHLHSRIPELIEQEIWAAATVFNIASRIRNELNEKIRQKAHWDYRFVSLSFIISQLKETILGQHLPDRDIGRILSCCLRRSYTSKPGRAHTKRRKL